MKQSYAVILTTAGSREDAEAIARHLVTSRLAACVQLLPIHSFYRWDGAIQSEDEVLLLVKTRGALFEKIEAAIKEVHTYDVPEIVSLPISAGFEKYLSWIDEETE